jgi:hypothetical protein
LPFNLNLNSKRELFYIAAQPKKANGLGAPKPIEFKKSLPTPKTTFFRTSVFVVFNGLSMVFNGL